MLINRLAVKRYLNEEHKQIGKEGILAINKQMQKYLDRLIIANNSHARITAETVALVK